LIGGLDRILNRVVDADAADGRHDVGRVADQQQPRLVPEIHAARLDVEDRALLPVGQVRGQAMFEEQAIEITAQVGTTFGVDKEVVSSNAPGGKTTWLPRVL